MMSDQAKHSSAGSVAHNRLPPGPRKIPEPQAREHQRQRLIDALTILSVELGYNQVVVVDIVARAMVSKSTFYHFYENKTDCLFDAHKRHSARLIAAVDAAAKSETPSSVALLTAVRVAIEFCLKEPEVAQLLTIGILSAGPEGVDRYRTTIAAIADHLAPLENGDLPSRVGDILAGAFFAAATALDPGAPEVLPDTFIRALGYIGDSA